MPLCKSTDLHFEYCVLVQSSQKTPTGGREAVKNGNKNEWFSYMKLKVVSAMEDSGWKVRCV